MEEGSDPVSDFVLGSITDMYGAVGWGFVKVRDV